MTSARGGSSFEVDIVDDVVRVVVAGVADAEVFLAAIAEVVEVERDRPSTAMLLDGSGLVGLELTDEDMYRVVTALRTRIGRHAGYRCAVVAPPELVGALGGDFVQVRDLLAGTDDVADVRPFVELASARAWLAET